MKPLILMILAAIMGNTTHSQAVHKTTTTKTTSTKTISTSKTSQKATNTPQVKTNANTTAHPTSVYDNSTRAAGGNTGTSSQATKNESPFVGGIHPAKDAVKTFDTLNAANTNATSLNNQNSVQLNTGSDTAFNTNTTTNNGVTTNSGAVDKSGQAQFGQTNWGRNSRNTVGESQWTIPPPVTSTFRKEFPDAASPTWSRNNTDTSLYFARYRAGTSWASSTYNAAGERLNTHYEIPLVQAPRPVNVYLAKQASGFRLSSISRVEMQGKPEVYEIITSTGKTIYVNNDGVETTLQ